MKQLRSLTQMELAFMIAFAKRRERLHRQYRMPTWIALEMTHEDIKFAIRADWVHRFPWIGRETDMRLHLVRWAAVCVEHTSWMWLDHDWAEEAT